MIKSVKKLREWSQVHHSDGFGLVEVMIAGVITIFTLSAVGRFTQAAMVSSAKQAERTRLEATIQNNIQEIQQQDSRLTWEIVNALAEEDEACQNPVSYLKSKLETKASNYHVPAPTNVNRSISDASSQTTLTESTPAVAIITYSFDGPEKSVGNEKRILELNPTFHADCLEKS